MKNRDFTTYDKMAHQKNGFKIVLNDGDELESLTGGGSTFFNSTRNFVANRIGKKKCLFFAAASSVLVMLAFGTIYILQTAAEANLNEQTNSFAEQSMIDLKFDRFEARIESLENELKEIREMLKDRPTHRALMPSLDEDYASGDDDYSSQLTDDESLLSESDRFTKNKLVGKWKQIRLENMEEYLKAEGASWIFRKLALGVPPELEIADLGNHRFMQIFTAPMYRGEFPIWLDGEVPEYEDGAGTTVVGRSEEHGDSVVITADGGKNGQVVTTLYFKGDEMHLTTVLTEKGGVSASRVFKRNN